MQAVVEVVLTEHQVLRGILVLVEQVVEVMVVPQMEMILGVLEVLILEVEEVEPLQ